MPDYDKLRRVLREFSARKPPELLVKDLEKRLLKPLNVERKPDRSGVSVIYYHPAAEQVNTGGLFTAHRIHGRKRVFIRKCDFIQYLLPSIEAVIEYEEGQNSEGD